MLKSKEKPRISAQKMPTQKSTLRITETRGIMPRALRIFFFTTIVLIVLLLFGCVEWIGGKNETVFVKRQKPTEPNELVENITNITNVSKVTICEELETDAEECILERAFTNNNISDCFILKNFTMNDTLNDLWFRDCLMKLATKNLAACSYLNDTNSIDDCYFYASRAYEDSVCDRIINITKKETCKLEFVSEECRSFAQFERYLCDAIKKDNEAICVKSGQYDYCLLEFSIQAHDVCSEITNKGMREGCKAILEKSDNRCSSLDNAADDLCYKIYATKRGECASCSKISATIDSWRDDCYSTCAVVANNSFYCSQLSTEIKRDNCYLSFASNRTDVTVCKKIKMKSLMKLCYERVAVAAIDPTICDNLEAMDKSNCYVKVFSLPNLTYNSCIKMTPSYDRDTCIFSVVKNTHEITYCESIADSSLKEYCRQLRAE